MTEDVANLSPAKHCPVTVSVPVVPADNTSSLGFSTQTSMGFQLIGAGVKSDRSVTTSQLSDSDSASDEERPAVVTRPGRQGASWTGAARSGKQSTSRAVTAVSSSSLQTRWTSAEHPGALSEGGLSQQKPSPAESLRSATGKRSKKKKRKQDEDSPSQKKAKFPVDGVVSIFQAALMEPPGGVASALVEEREGVSGWGKREEPSVGMVGGTGAASPSSPLIVSIALNVCKVAKPKAKVEPYNVVRPTPQRRSTSDGIGGTEQEEGRGISGARDGYGSVRLRPDEFPGHASRLRGHPTNRWERDDRERRTYGLSSHVAAGPREFTVGRSNPGDYTSARGGGGVDYPRAGGDYSARTHGWDRDTSYRGPGEEYWFDYEGSRMDSQRGAVGGNRRGYSAHRQDPDSYMEEARKRKKEADKMVRGQMGL